VTTTVREANDRGFECCILSDCTSGFNSSFVQISMEMISAYDGLFGYVAPSQDLLAQCTPRSQLTPPLTPPAEEQSPEHDLRLDYLRQRYTQELFDPVQLVHNLYDWIEATESTFPNVWIHLRSRADVLNDASRLQKAYAERPRPPLYGVPFAVKDNFDVAGLPTTAACAPYAYTPIDTAPSVTALLDAGALLIGKTNMDQLATGLSGCRSPYGSASSVYGQSKYISGGSSSGSGVAVAAQMVSFALGTDTAGSGRVPAALNGIVGLKPTKGTISARGIVPACKSLDTVSVFATCVSDARSVWQVLDAHDAEDAYAKPISTLPVKAVDFRGVKSAGFSFTIPPPEVLELCSSIYRSMFADTVRRLEALGGRLVPLSVTTFEPFQAANNLLYSGTLVNERVACIGYDFISNNLERLHPTTRTLFTAILNRDSKPWDLFADQIKQAEYTRKAHQLFEEIDVMVLPAVPCHPTLRDMEQDSIKLNARMGEFTHFANVLDLCAVNINAAFYEAEDGKMPFGISLIGGMGMDGKTMDIAAFIEERINVS
jgi:allophanate hydrolase